MRLALFTPWMVRGFGGFRFRYVQMVTRENRKLETHSWNFKKCLDVEIPVVSFYLSTNSKETTIFEGDASKIIAED